MFTNNLIQNEYDILLETQSKAIYLIDDTKNILNKKHIDIIDKEYIIQNIKRQINLILNTAFNNRNMPENYIKPDKQYMELLKIAYSMNDEQYNNLLNYAKSIKGENEW